VRIVVDLDLCQGHAVCESEAPGIFEVPKHGKVTILEASPPADRRREVEQAVKFCPTHALKVEEG
jgi:ferredoxin